MASSNGRAGRVICFVLSMLLVWTLAARAQEAWIPPPAQHPGPAQPHS